MFQGSNLLSLDNSRNMNYMTQQRQALQKEVVLFIKEIKRKAICKSCFLSAISCKCSPSDSY